MKIRELEAKVAKLEASPRFSTFARMSDADLEREIVANMNILVSGFPSYDAMIASFAGSPDPSEREAARDMRTFLADYIARQQQAAQ